MPCLVDIEMGFILAAKLVGGQARCALARLKVTGRLGDFCGRERLVYERSQCKTSSAEIAAAVSIEPARLDLYLGFCGGSADLLSHNFRLGRSFQRLGRTERSPSSRFGRIDLILPSPLFAC